MSYNSLEILLLTKFWNINCNLIEIWQKQRPTNLDNHDIIYTVFLFISSWRWYYFDSIINIDYCSLKILISQNKTTLYYKTPSTSILLFENDPDPLMTPLLNYWNALISYLLHFSYTSRDPFMKNINDYCVGAFLSSSFNSELLVINLALY